MSTATMTRRARWQYPQPQPTPRILQLPRRHRKKPPPKTYFPCKVKESRGKLEALFDQEEREEQRRCRVAMLEDEKACDDVLLVEEEKWRFQAEMLRAECNLLRIEREVAVKKMERRRVQVERVLRSAVQSLVSGRNKICEGENARTILEQEIKNLVDKLEKLKHRRRSGFPTPEAKSFSNFDKQATFLQQQLGVGVGDEICVKEIREMAEASLSIKSICRENESVQVEILRRKMEGLSNGMLLERMEDEFGSMLSTHSSASTSTSKPIEFLDMSSLSTLKQSYKSNKVCSGHCRTIVRRIVEQVRSETEQWSQMQEMLGQVRDEMEELQASRDFWEDRALGSDYQIQSLCSAVQDWRQKAICSETKVNELQSEVNMLRKEMQWLKEKQDSGSSRAKISSPTEMEKRVLVCRLKQKEVFGTKRSPLGDIRNLSSTALVRQNSKAVVFPLHVNGEGKL